MIAKFNNWRNNYVTRSYNEYILKDIKGGRAGEK